MPAYKIACILCKNCLPRQRKFIVQARSYLINTNLTVKPAVSDRVTICNFNNGAVFRAAYLTMMVLFMK